MHGRRSWGLGVLTPWKYIGRVRVSSHPIISHSFIRNCCWITLQVSHRQRLKACVKREGKTNFLRRLKQFDGLAWLTLTPGCPPPLFYDRSTPLLIVNEHTDIRRLKHTLLGRGNILNICCNTGSYEMSKRVSEYCLNNIRQSSTWRLYTYPVLPGRLTDGVFICRDGFPRIIWRVLFSVYLQPLGGLAVWACCNWCYPAVLPPCQSSVVMRLRAHALFL